MRERGLKTVCGVGSVVKDASSLQLAGGRFTNANALRKTSCTVVAQGSLGSYGRSSACVLVMGARHDKTQKRTTEEKKRLAINCNMILRGMKMDTILNQ